MSNPKLNTIAHWRDKINFAYLASSGVEDCAERITDIIESPDFLSFLWKEFSYWRANIYTSDPDGHFECLHRGIDNKRLAFQIRVPWLCIHMDNNGTLSPKLERAYKVIRNSEKPQLADENFRDEYEAKLFDKRQREEITSSTRLYHWYKNHCKDMRRFNELCIVVTEGEMLFYRLMTDLDFRGQITARETNKVIEWINDNAKNNDVINLISPLKVADFIKSLHGKKITLTTDRVDLAWDTTKINPKREMTILKSRNIVFFPCGKFYSHDHLSEVFFLGSFYDTKKMLDNISAIIALFSDLAFKGISLYEQKLGEEKLIYDRHHEFGNTIARLQSTFNRNLSPNQKLREIRKKIALLRECYYDWIDPKRLESIEKVDISQILKELKNLSESTPYPKHFSHLKSIYYVKANKRLLSSSIFELIRNSIKHTNETLIDNYLKISAKIENNRVFITISDMANSLTEEIFKESANNPILNQNGAHKGLYTSRKYIEKLGGTLSFHPKQPRGSILIITLPVER